MKKRAIYFGCFPSWFYCGILIISLLIFDSDETLIISLFVFLSRSTKHKPFSLMQFLKRQAHILHGEEERDLRYVPKVSVRFPVKKGS